MSENRRDYLLREAAKAFDQLIDPFSHAWLMEHEVSADECTALSDGIAAILFGYLVADQEVRDAIMRAYGSRALGELLLR